MTKNANAPEFKSEEKSSLRAVVSRLGRSRGASEVDQVLCTAEDASRMDEPRVSDMLNALFDQFGYALDEADRDNFRLIFSLLPGTPQTMLELLTGGRGTLENVIKERFPKVLKRQLLGKLARLNAIADELKVSPLKKPWLDIDAFFTEFERLEARSSNELSDTEKEYLRFLCKVAESGLMRSPCAVPDPAALLGLIDRFPNFAEPLHFLAEQCAFAKLRGDASFRAIPLLLCGPAGVGKTHFAMALSELFATRLDVMSIASQTAGFCLSGLDRGWSNARTGMIFDALLYGTTLSPVVVLDEIDKAGSGNKHDPLGPLYALLEIRTGRVFRDEFAGFSIDASQILWMATANEASTIPGPLLSRFKVFNVVAPTSSQVLQIANTVYKEIGNGLAGAPEEMPAYWQQHLSGQSVRTIRALLQEALGTAALRAVMAGEASVSVNDQDLKCRAESDDRRMGFC